MGSVLDFLAALDLIDRLDELVGNARYGPHHRFYVPRDCGWSGGEIELLLARHGVRIWGRGCTPDSLYFHVKQKQANWAEYLLMRRGIPVLSQPVNPRNEIYAEKYTPGSEPPNWRWHQHQKAKPNKSWLDTFLSLFDGK